MNQLSFWFLIVGSNISSIFVNLLLPPSDLDAFAPRLLTKSDSLWRLSQRRLDEPQLKVLDVLQGDWLLPLISDGGVRFAGFKDAIGTATFAQEVHNERLDHV